LEYCKQGACAIHLIMEESAECLKTKCHCRTGLLYKQRMYQNFKGLAEKLEPMTEVKESYLLSWAYVLEKVPKTVLNNDVVKVSRPSS
jgi:hypothetical protein